MTIGRICAIEPFTSPVVAQVRSLEDAGSALEILTQVLENYLARLRSAVCDDIEEIVEECCGSTAPDSFLSLTDTPDTYAGAAGFGVAVNAGATGLVFIPPPAPSFLSLTDTPATYAGSGGFAVAVKGTEDGLEFVAFPTPVLEPIPITGRLICMVKPFSGTTLGATGVSIVGHNEILPTGATASHPVPSNASVLAGFYRYRINSAGVAGSTAVIRETVGTVLGFTGWRMVARWGTATAVAQQRFFVGLINTPGVIANVNPSTLLNLVGISYDSAQTNLFFIHNDGAGAATTVSLGASFPVNATSFYEMEITMAPGSGVVNYRVLNIGTGAIATGSTNTNLPADATLLNLYLWLNNGTTATLCTVDMNLLYTEAFR